MKTSDSFAAALILALWISCETSLLALAASAAVTGEDPLEDLRAEARREIAAAAKLETRTEMVTGAGRQVPQTTITLTTGECRYKLQYACAMDEAGRRLEMGFTLSELGMLEPSPANWYQGGFIDVLLDGVGLVQVPAKVQPMVVPEGSAGVQFIWTHPRGPVNVSFRTFSFDPFLYVSVEMPPAEQRQVTLLCYPNSFQVPRDRWITTPKRDIPHRVDLKETLPNEERDWILYSDRAAGLVAAPTTGPCGLVLLPDQIAGLNLEMGRPERPDWPGVQNYGVFSYLYPPADVRRLCFALIDFLPTTWTQAEAKLRGDAPRVQERLAKLLSKKP